MKKIIYTVWGVPHKAVKVATCNSSGVYTNYASPSRKRNGTANKMLCFHNDSRGRALKQE